MPAGQNSPDRLQLKEASKRLIRAAGGEDAAAEFARPGGSMMHDYGSPNNSDRFMPIDVVVDLEAITRGTPGWPMVTRLLAAKAGCSLVELPKAGAVDADWHAELARLSDESSDVLKGICRALMGDNRVTARDVRELRLVEECDELILAIVTIKALLERVPTATD